MTYLSESQPGRRRRRRQRVTLAFFVLLVLGAGLVAAGLYLGVIGAASPSTYAAPKPCTSAAPAPLVPRRVKVNVYNATGRAGLAANTATRLRLRGFVIGEVANDPARAKVNGAALIRYGRKGSGAAKLLAVHVPAAKLAADKRTTTVVDLVLGAAFTTIGPEPKPAAATPTTPSCASGTPSPPTSGTRTGVPKTRPTTTPR